MSWLFWRGGGGNSNKTSSLQTGVQWSMPRARNTTYRPVLVNTGRKLQGINCTIPDPDQGRAMRGEWLKTMLPSFVPCEHCTHLHIPAYFKSEHNLRCDFPWKIFQDRQPPNPYGWCNLFKWARNLVVFLLRRKTQIINLSWLNFIQLKLGLFWIQNLSIHWAHNFYSLQIWCRFW